jgi:hypothetical protein
VPHVRDRGPSRFLGELLRRRRAWPRRQETEWIEIAVLVEGLPDPEVDIRTRDLGLAAGSDRPDDIAFHDLLAGRD